MTSGHLAGLGPTSALQLSWQLWWLWQWQFWQWWLRLRCDEAVSWHWAVTWSSPLVLHTSCASPAKIPNLLFLAAAFLFFLLKPRPQQWCRWYWRDSAENSNHLSLHPGHPPFFFLNYYFLNYLYIKSLIYSSVKAEIERKYQWFHSQMANWVFFLPLSYRF